MPYKDVAFKNLSKYTTITMSYEKSEELLTWFRQSGISPLIPPVYPEFVIHVTSVFTDRVPDKSYSTPFPTYHEERRVYELDYLIQYDDSRTKFRVICWLNSKKYLIVDADCTVWAVESGKIQGSYTPLSDYGKKAGEKNTGGILQFVIAVQAYMLYHRPDIVNTGEIRHTAVSTQTPNDAAKRTKPVQKPIKIKSTIKKYIVIGDDEHPPKHYTYRTMSWSVRGHYQRYGHDKKLLFIQPHICQRGKPHKPREKKYEIED